MPEYCTASDMQQRLTAAGYEFAADRDFDQQVTDQEVTDNVTPAIEHAGTLIDAALYGQTTTADARAAGNNWLKHRAVDIAVVRALENGGREVPPDLRTAHDAAIAMLDDVKDGALVPGLTYQKGLGSSLSTRKVRIKNVG